MEDAALALEGVAFSTRAPGPHRYRPVDSVPFLETSTTYGAGCIASSLSAPRRDDGSGNDNARPQRELTSAYTCIIADPMVFDNAPIAAAQMGLDIDVDAESEFRCARMPLCRLAISTGGCLLVLLLLLELS